jgi:hypothetical protein
MLAERTGVRRLGFLELGTTNSDGIRARREKPRKAAQVLSG